MEDLTTRSILKVLTHIEITIGSSYQGFRREAQAFSRDNQGAEVDPFEAFNENILISVYARATSLISRTY